mmetsp:Transcript_18588/g.43983  ORF Transcript_18588/g.43983 Transcript_18588/m.43983 type:complete len:259 (-) Transcript_18588:94-870(-)
MTHRASPSAWPTQVPSKPWTRQSSWLRPDTRPPTTPWSSGMACSTWLWSSLATSWSSLASQSSQRFIAVFTASPAFAANCSCSCSSPTPFRASASRSSVPECSLTSCTAASRKRLTKGSVLAAGQVTSSLRSSPRPHGHAMDKESPLTALQIPGPCGVSTARPGIAGITRFSASRRRYARWRWLSGPQSCTSCTSSSRRYCRRTPGPKLVWTQVPKAQKELRRSWSGRVQHLARPCSRRQSRSTSSWFSASFTHTPQP